MTRRLPALALGLLCAACCALAPPGCTSATTGARVEQAITGQKSANSGANAVSFIDGQPFSGPTFTVDGTQVEDTFIPGTTVVNGTSPVERVVQEAGKTTRLSTGQVTRTLTIKRPDGLEMSLTSGSNAEGRVLADPATGNVTEFTFNTSSSDPLRALADVEKLKTELEAKIAAGNVDLLKNISGDSKEFLLGLVESVSPILATALRAAWPAP